MDITLHGIPNCDTVKKARAWLADHGIACHFHDFRKAGASRELIAGWVAMTSWELLVNRRGTTWRGLSEARRAAVVDADSAIALMAESPSVIRRPVLVISGVVQVGFSADMYGQIFELPQNS
jgi:arsenate reductase